MGRALNVAMVEIGGWGGLGHYTYNLSRSLAQRGCRVTLITGRPYELQALPRDFELNDVLQADAPYADRLRLIAGCVRRCGARLVHVQSTLSARLDWIWLSMAKWTGYRSVLTVHNTLPHDESERDAPGMSAAFGQLYRASDRLILHSLQARDELRRWFRVPARKMSVIPHGNYLFADRGRCIGSAEARRRLGLPESGPVLLCFGTIRPYKGIPDLLRALAMALERGVAAHLVVAGKPISMSTGGLAADIQDLGLSGRVILHPDYVAQERVPEYFAAADIVVLPYRRITQSGALQLAYAFGKPVIATRVGAFPESVEEGVNGLLVAPGSPAALAQAICTLLGGNGPDLAEMGRRSRELAETRYAWSRIAQKTICAYERALSG